jgi:hypothetical protein
LLLLLLLLLLLFRKQVTNNESHMDLTCADDQQRLNEIYALAGLSPYSSELVNDSRISRTSSFKNEAGLGSPIVANGEEGDNTLQIHDLSNQYGEVDIRVERVDIDITDLDLDTNADGDTNLDENAITKSEGQYSIDSSTIPFNVLVADDSMLQRNIIKVGKRALINSTTSSV